MPRVRALPPLDELAASLREAGVEALDEVTRRGADERSSSSDAPTEGPDDAARGLLDLALFLVEHDKRVSFGAFSWDDPRFAAGDAKVAFDVAYARLAPGERLRDALLRELPRVARRQALLALDARGTDLREFDAVHEIYGQVTLFAWPHKPHESADPRVDAARERGWVRTLKEHNLLPGRGIVVLDEHQGLFLTEPALASLMGVLLLLPTGMITLLWNPFVEADRNDSELQYWLQWGRGTGSSSEWREVLRVDEADDA